MKREEKKIEGFKLEESCYHG